MRSVSDLKTTLATSNAAPLKAAFAAQPTAATTYAAMVGRAIVHARKKAKVPRAKLARAIGITPKEWTPIEHGRRDLTADQLNIVARKLALTPLAILTLAAELVETAKGHGLKVVASADEAKAAGYVLVEVQDVMLAVKTTLEPQARKRSESPRKKKG